MTKAEEAKNLLQTYNGQNPFIRMIKYNMDNKKEEPNAFAIDYIIKNKDYVAVPINKVMEIGDWYAKQKQEQWKISFVPKKIMILTLLGETSTAYHCYIKYKQNMDKPVQAFLPKKALIGELITPDTDNIKIDFNKYDNITTAKNPERKLREHQKTAVKFLVSRNKCVLADGMGLGKTASLIVGALEKDFDRVLIVCPASIKTAWKREIEWYRPESEITIIESTDGMTKNELMDFFGYKTTDKKLNELKEEAKQLSGWKNNRFNIVNYDILNRFYKIPVSRSKANIELAYKESPMLQYLKEGKKTLLIIDEAHRLSNRTSIRFKVLKDLVKKSECNSVWMATGTPITNRPINLYNVLSVINAEITQDWQWYVERYCDGKQIPAKGEWAKWLRTYQLNNHIQTPWSMMSREEKSQASAYIMANVKKIWITSGASHLDELEKKISDIYLRRIKEDIPGMVNKTIIEKYYDLTRKEKREYEELWNDYERAQNEMGKEPNKDLLEGAIYRKYISDHMVPHTEELVDDIIENEDNSKVIVACCYDDELYALQKYYGSSCVIYNGKMSIKQKDSAQETFMNDPKVRVFIGNIAAAGVGLTLTSAKYCVFNNFSFVTGDNQQFMDRIHRLNQTKDVEVIFQIFRDTQYEKMWDIVLKKAYVIEQVIKKENDKK